MCVANWAEYGNALQQMGTGWAIVFGPFLIKNVPLHDEKRSSHTCLLDHMNLKETVHLRKIRIFYLVLNRILF